jgi:hypothetical protein
MSAGHSEPQVLFSVNDIKAYHVQDGEEHSLTPSGPQTLSLLMVPTSSPFVDLSNTDPTSTAPEEDFYLHLHLPPELDQPLPATTQIYHKPPSSYLIPRWDLGPDSGAFIRIEFPGIGNSTGKVTQEDVDTFETILAQCTAFLERAGPPKGYDYNPAAYAPGEGYISSRWPELPARHGQIVLIDEENGSVVGELQNSFSVVEASSVKPGSKSELPTAPFTNLAQFLTLCAQIPYKSHFPLRVRAIKLESVMCRKSSCASFNTQLIGNRLSCKRLLWRRGSLLLDQITWPKQFPQEPIHFSKGRNQTRSP